MRNLKKVLSVLLVVVMLATAMVPAFAADTYTYSAQAKTLYDLGLFKGLSSTEYVPDLGTALTREQGFALIVRLLGNDDDAAALKAADVDAALAPFGDVKDVEPTLKNTIAYAVKNGLVIGDTSKLLNAKGPMLGKDFATVLLRKLGYADTEFTYDTATVDLANKGGLDATVAAKLASKALIRDDAAGMMYAALQAKYKTGETIISKLVASKDVDEAKAIAAGVYVKPVAAAVTAKVTGAKKFTLTFSAPVDSAKVTASSVTVKRGASTYAVTDFKLADDKKSAVVTISNQIGAGTYSVAVTGLADAAVTASVTAENERVDSIKFTTDSAVLKSITSFTDVEVAYKVYNQYGEDITTKSYSNVEFTSSKGSLTKADSKLTLSVVDPASFIVGEKITVTASYIDTDNAKTVFTSAVVTVSQMAQVTELSISKLYNADNATLDINSTYSDFYLLVDAKDQYGNTVSYSNLAAALVMQSTDPSVLNIANSFVQVTIDGSKKTALALAPGNVADRSGIATVILISKYSGKVAQFDVTVKDSQKIDTLTLQTPDYPVAEEIVKVPFTAIDKDGNEITKLSGLVMGDGTKTLTVSGAAGVTAKFEQDPVSGKPVLNLDARNVHQKTTLYLTGTTGSGTSYKFVSFSITLELPAKLDSVSGFKSSIYTNILVNNYSTDFSYGNVLVKDSKGRDVSKDQLVSKYGLNLPNTYRFTLASSDATKVSVTPTVAGETYAVIDANTTPTVTAVAKGGVTATLKLQKYNTTTNKWEDVSTNTFALAAVKNADLQSYAPTSVTSVYTSPDGFYAGSHKAEIKVEGVLANGKKVLVPKTVAGSTYYDVTTTGAISYDGAKYIYAAGSGTGLATDETATGTYTVTIYGANGTVNVPVNTTVSGAVPVATAVSLNATTDITGLKDASNVSRNYGSYIKEGDTVASIDLTRVPNEAAVKAAARDFVKIVDQYGKTCKDISVIDPTKSLIKDIKVSDVRDTDNKIVDSSTPYAVGYSVYVTVITTNGTTFGFTLAFK